MLFDKVNIWFYDTGCDAQFFGYSIHLRKRIIAQIEREQALVDAYRELITLFEEKIKHRIAKVWGE